MTQYFDVAEATFQRVPRRDGTSRTCSVFTFDCSQIGASRPLDEKCDGLLPLVIGHARDERRADCSCLLPAKIDHGLRYAGSPVIIDGRANEVDATVLQFGHTAARSQFE